MHLNIGGHSVTLLPDKAVQLADGTVVVADLHLGRGHAYQTGGLALPHDGCNHDLDRLTQLCRQQHASRLVINGDLFHSPAGLPPKIEDAVEKWLATMEIPVELVLGNHEQKMPRLPSSLAIFSHVEHAGFFIVHDPLQAPADQASITAHWHPLAKIADGKRTSLRLPSFLVRGPMLVLPAFGTFSGGAVIAPEPGDRHFIAPAHEVIKVPPDLLG